LLCRDDCAIVESQGKKNLLVLKTDCVVEKIHFAPATDPIHVGWKAMMRALSDSLRSPLFRKLLSSH